MTRIVVIGGRHNIMASKLLSEVGGIELVDAKELASPELMLTCQIRHEDFSHSKVHVEPLKNNETWRGNGKRRKPMCK